MKIITLLSAPAHASTLSGSCEIPDALCTDPISVGELLAIESKTEPLNLLSKSLCACVDHSHVLLSVGKMFQTERIVPPVRSCGDNHGGARSVCDIFQNLCVFVSLPVAVFVFAFSAAHL